MMVTNLKHTKTPAYPILIWETSTEASKGTALSYLVICTVKRPFLKIENYRNLKMEKSPEIHSMAKEKVFQYLIKPLQRVYITTTIQITLSILRKRDISLPMVIR